MLWNSIRHFMVRSTICNLSNWFVFHNGNELVLGRGSIVGCSNADWSNCSRRDSGTAVVLGEEAASVWPMSQSSSFSQLRQLSVLAFVFCFPAWYLMLKVKKLVQTPIAVRLPSSRGFEPPLFPSTAWLTAMVSSMVSGGLYSGLLLFWLPPLWFHSWLTPGQSLLM